MSALDLDALEALVLEDMRQPGGRSGSYDDRLRATLALITRLRAAEARTADLRAGLERVTKRCAEGGEQALAEAQCALDWDDDRADVKP